MVNKEKEKADIFERVWSFFTSVKLTIVILIILALTSIIGTIVEQRAEPVKNIALLTKLFGDSTAPTVYNIFVKFGFMDMYHSWWFVSLLILFSTNLIVCSLERFPKTLRLIKTPQKPLGENVIKTLPIKKELKFKTNLKTAKDEILNTLTASRYRVFEATEEGAVQLYSQKGKYTRLGVYIVHLSIILIFVGAIIGARFGFGGYLNLPEGGSASFVHIRTGSLTEAEQFERKRIIATIEASQGDISLASKRLGIDKDVLNAKMKKYGIKPFGFTIKCNWYNTEYYDHSDMPQEFQSELVIIDGGKEVLKKVIEVNSPFTYKGITFYQSSYGMIPEAIGEFILKITSRDGQENTLRLRPGETFEITDTNIKGTIVDFYPAFTIDRQTGAFTNYKDTMANPAVAIEFDAPNMEKFIGAILKRYPETGNLPDGSQIKFVDYWGVEYTGLQVSKDPGVGLIYFACIIMTLGLYIAFFMSHKKIWISLINEKNSVRISVGGSASKNRLSFEREIEKISSKVSQAIDGKSKK